MNISNTNISTSITSDLSAKNAGEKNMDQPILGRIHSTESFGSADGPGVRFLVFLQGCNMRCKYCHNPDTWKKDGGTLATPEEILNKALKYRNYWGKNGGITVSGGEALLQIDFVIELFRLAKTQNIHTTLDTSGNPFSRQELFFDKFKQLMEVTDLFILDLKHIDDSAHRDLTGQTNENIKDMAKCLSDHGKDMWIRHVLVPGYTDSEEQLTNLQEFIATLSTVKRIEILPYHTLGVFKWKELGVNYSLDDVVPPSKEEIQRAKELLKIS